MDWLETLLFALLATFKFAVAVPFYILEERLSFWEALIFSLSSGTFGIILFMYLSTRILRIWEWIKAKTGLFQKKKERRVFTRKNRRLVRIKSRYGLPGIAFLSPFIISLPVGCFLAVRFYKNKRKVFFYMLAGVVFWSLIYSAFASIIVKLLKSLEEVAVVGL